MKYLKGDVFYSKTFDDYLTLIVTQIHLEGRKEPNAYALLMQKDLTLFTSPNRTYMQIETTIDRLIEEGYILRVR